MRIIEKKKSGECIIDLIIEKEKSDGCIIDERIL